MVELGRCLELAFLTDNTCSSTRRGQNVFKSRQHPDANEVITFGRDTGFTTRLKRMFISVIITFGSKLGSSSLEMIREPSKMFFHGQKSVPPNFFFTRKTDNGERC